MVTASLLTATSAGAARGVAAGAYTGMVITLVPVVVPPGRGAYKGVLPPRMRWLHPDAAQWYAGIANLVVVSDMYRSAESSLSAMQTKQGVLSPGLSRHGYGLAIDIDTRATMGLLGFTQKRTLDEWMAGQGWVCHRIDHAMKSEAWHMNWLATGHHDDAWRKGEPSTRAAGERQLQRLYGAAMKLDARQAQAMLAKLGMYAGQVDGRVGPLTMQAAAAFGRAWKVKGGIADASFQRVLAFVSAEHRTPDGRRIDIRSGTVL